MSPRYNIGVHGCDDSTQLRDVELTEAEHATVTRLVTLVEAASGYGCQPTITVEPFDADAEAEL